MNYKEYLKESEKTVSCNTMDYYKLNAVNECGELLTPLKRTMYHNIPFDKDNVIEELGDILWSIAGFTRVLLTIDTKDTEALVNFFNNITDKIFVKTEVNSDCYLEEVVADIYILMSLLCRNKSISLGKIMIIYSLILKKLDITLETVMDYNIDKLRKRHGEAYNQDSWVARGVVKEDDWEVI